MCLSPTGNDSEVKCIQYWSCRHNLCETVDPNQTQNSLNTESYLWISSIVAFKKRDNLHYSINTNIKINEVKFTHQADLELDISVDYVCYMHGCSILFEDSPKIFLIFLVPRN